VLLFVYGDWLTPSMRYCSRFSLASNTNLGALQVRQLCEGLIHTPLPALSVLNLSDNRFGLEGARSIAQFLAADQTLQMFVVTCV
jgi:hypothetical protein